LFPSELGKEVHSEWIKTPEIRQSMNLKLGEFIVMPDHFHAVISIGENDFNQEHERNRMGIQTQNLGSVIRGFKSAVTSYARKNDIEFEWQPRFHDRIIRTDKELVAIEEYIRNNVTNWGANRSDLRDPLI
jgi:putative transposase